MHLFVGQDGLRFPVWIEASDGLFEQTKRGTIDGLVGDNLWMAFWVSALSGLNES